MSFLELWTALIAATMAGKFLISGVIGLLLILYVTYTFASKNRYYSVRRNPEIFTFLLLLMGLFLGLLVLYELNRPHDVQQHQTGESENWKDIIKEQQDFFKKILAENFDQDTVSILKTDIERFQDLAGRSLKLFENCDKKRDVLLEKNEKLMEKNTELAVDREKLIQQHKACSNEVEKNAS